VPDDGFTGALKRAEAALYNPVSLVFSCETPVSTAGLIWLLSLSIEFNQSHAVASHGPPP
jgi:hypothetical protein